jgi:3-oxoacyl-[acyl-carrier-protein] synthase III
MRIETVQHAVPSRRITNDTVLEEIRRSNRDRLSPDALAAVERQVTEFLAASGTQVRYLVDDGEKPLDFVLDAGRKALEHGGVQPGDVEFVIYTGVGRGWLEPATANVVQHGLKLANATCFDILDACASWLRALQVAHSLIRGRVYRRGLIVNGECGFRRYVDLDLTDPRDIEHRLAAFTIGEAATATLVTDDDPDDDFHFNLRNFGEHYDLCMIPLGNAADFAPDNRNGRHAPSRFYAVSSRLVATTIQKIVETFQSDPKLRGGRYDICFGHAASERASQLIGLKLGLPYDIYYSTHPDYGNTVSASVPLGMSLALADGRARRGDKVLVIVGSAGITVGLASFTL